MSVDYRLQPYWNNATAFNRTKDPVWLNLLRIIAETDDGPSGRAAQKVVNVA